MQAPDEFQVGDRRYGTPLPDDDGWGARIADDNNIKLSSLVEKDVDRFLYIYDFGDDWRHEVVIEGVRPAEPGVAYPVFVAGARRCPPEDCGGPPGYEAVPRGNQRSRAPRPCRCARVVWRPL